MPSITRETVSDEALLILRNLRENADSGRSNKLADVKTNLEPSVSLEFDSYFFFLRKYHYIAMDREAQLKLTDQGNAVVEGDYFDKFQSEVGEFFSDQLMPPDEMTQGAGAMVSDLLPENTGELEIDEPLHPPPPPPVAAMPPPPPGAKSLPRSAPAGDEPLTPPPQSGGFTARVDVPSLRRDPSPSYSSQVPSVPPPSTTPSSAGSMNIPAAPATVSGARALDNERYLKGDPIGQGPLGTVFRAKHGALGTEISVKELKDIFGYFSFLQRGEVIKRLRKELCAQAQVKHAGVVQILDQNTDVARPYFVMEVLNGSLRERLDGADGKGLPVQHALRCFLQSVYALQAAHASGLTHHNLKPENVLFDPYGNAKLGDFGLSRVIEVDQNKGMPQVFMGTGGMAYMAPELIKRDKDAGASADVYALGILLYEMLTGQLPGRRSPLPSEVNSEAPSKLDPIFDKMTQDKRDARYPDFDAVLDDFYGAFSDGEYLTKGDLVLSSGRTE